MTIPPYDSAARALLDALQPHLDQDDAIPYASIVLRMLDASPAVARLPLALRDDEVWPPGQLRDFRTYAAGLQPHPGGQGIRVVRYAQFIARVEGLAARDDAPAVSEWHFAEALYEDPTKPLAQLNIRGDLLLRRLARLLGRVALDEIGTAKLWCLCDANVFLEHRLFDSVAWPKVLGEGSPVVLVVPLAILREIDRQKLNARRVRLQTQARKVLPIFDELTEDVEPGSAVSVSTGVELMIQGREPHFFPPGLDPERPDDALVASALDFLWFNIGARVIVLSSDRTPRLKARALGLPARSVPAGLRLRAAQ